MNPWDLLIIAAGFIGGAANVIAGGGSFLTLPALMAAGLPINIANGTNRLAILVQALIATRQFKRSGHLDARLFWALLPALTLGAILGAYAATTLNPSKLRPIIGVLFLGMGLVSAVRDWRAKGKGNPDLQQGLQQVLLPQYSAPLRHLCLFAIGLYAGFLQAGATLWMVLAAVAFYQVDHLRANAVKLPLVLVFTIPALGIFLYAGQVEWYRGLLLCLGTVFGAHYGVKWTLKGGSTLVKRGVILVMLATGIILLSEGVFR